MPLDQVCGWARALAAGAVQMSTELLGISRVQREELALMAGTEQFVLVERRRRAADGSVVSLERSLIPAVDGLEQLR